VTLFGLDVDADKRSKLVANLLASDDYARNWAAYWRDVIFLRATEQRARIVQPVFEQWLTEQLQANAAWDEIVTELLTAEGSIGEDGNVGLIFAHTGQPAELAAETSRIFLGIQIQCANCHDHPNDSWTREQFHQLAAFFPRIQVRPETPGEVRTFAVTTVDPNPRQQRRGQFPEDPDAAFRRLDRNRDGRVTKAEARGIGRFGENFDQILAANDKDSDGAFSLEEFKGLRRPNMNQQPGAAAAEYFMPDLNDPASPGTMTAPAFFVNGNSLEFGASGAERRDALADFMTAKDNPWFSKAFVNRMWCELAGSGFYMPVDDLGPQREATHPEALELLATAFAANDYDMRWLLTTLVATKTYQRELADEPGLSVASVSPTRMRADQIFNSLEEVLGPDQAFRGRGGPQGGLAQRSPRGQFSELFGYDPSTPQDEITGNIPQALFLMNSPRVNSAIQSRGNTRLARILEKFPNDRDAVSEVYLLVLSREPSDREIEIAAGYVKSVGQRGEAFEDLMWSLVNSSEFLSKR